MLRRAVTFTCWAYATWILLTWTRTVSQLLFGLGLSIAVGIACAGIGPAAGPWTLLQPKRLAGLVALATSALGRIVVANISLARRIWSPSLPIRSGMVIVPTKARTDGELNAVGLVTSVIVENQLVDIDRRRHELQYHAIDVETEDPDENYDQMNGPIERLVLASEPKRSRAGRSAR